MFRLDDLAVGEERLLQGAERSLLVSRHDAGFELSFFLPDLQSDSRALSLSSVLELPRRVAWLNDSFALQDWIESLSELPAKLEELRDLALSFEALQTAEASDAELHEANYFDLRSLFTELQASEELSKVVILDSTGEAITIDLGEVTIYVFQSVPHEVEWLCPVDTGDILSWESGQALQYLKANRINNLSPSVAVSLDDDCDTLMVAGRHSVQDLIQQPLQTLRQWVTYVDRAEGSGTANSGDSLSDRLNQMFV